MTTFTTLYADRSPRATVSRLLRTRLVRFLTAYVEMSVSMLVGMALLGLLWDSVWPGLTGRPDAMALTMAFDMTLGMSAWMWVRRHAARHIAEMSAVMVLPFVVLLVPYWLGVLPGDALLTWGHIAMFALMGAYLAWRPHAAASAPVLNANGDPHGSRTALVSSILLVGGAGLAVAGGLLHPHDEPPNSHVSVFTEYAHSSDWVWVHDLQFLSAALVVAGFLVLGRVLQRLGAVPTLVRLGTASAAATAALIAVNRAVDGVALKQAVDSWAAAAPDDRAARFAAAEAVRWVEWGVNSFFTILLGVTVLTFAAALASQAHLGGRVRLAGVTGGLAGFLLIANGLAVGAHGFEPSDLPLVTTGLSIVMALGVPRLDRAASTGAPRLPAAGGRLAPR
jgi:hypothetical protein